MKVFMKGNQITRSDALALALLVVVFISWSYITVNNQMFLNR
jgi:hypothetical protein